MPLGRYRIGIVAICFLIVLMDGFDTQAIGFVSTEVASSLNIPITAFGLVFSAGLSGAMLGAFVSGRSAIDSVAGGADRCSEHVRHVLVADTARGRLLRLLSLRFLAGFGLGGAIPNLLRCLRSIRRTACAAC